MIQVQAQSKLQPQLQEQPQLQQLPASLIEEACDGAQQMSAQKKNNIKQFSTKLPDYLLQFVDANIRCDTFNALRHRYMHYRIEDLIPHQIQSSATTPIWLFVDSFKRTDHLFIQAGQFLQLANVKASCEKIPSKDKQLTEITQEQYEGLEFQCKNCLASLLKEQNIEYLSKLQVTNLDQVRLKCEANLYFAPQELLKDITDVISWNQAFRANSKRAFLHISNFYINFVDLVTRRKFIPRFYEKKNKDFQDMEKLQLDFKINCQGNSWPFIPSKFREYEKINEYVPTPSNRARVINQRIRSQKEPVQCEDDCICIKQVLEPEESFCKYSLADVWESQCPNRRMRVECNHADQAKQKRCRNSEIKKKMKMQCKATTNLQNTIPSEKNLVNQQGSQLQSTQSANQIEQFMAWGMDLFTRSIIFYCLPEIDIIQPCTSQKNTEKKHEFIEKSLQRALNFLDNKGYNLDQACQFIIKNGPKRTEKANGSQTAVKGKQIWRAKSKIKQQQQQQQKKKIAVADNDASSLFTQNDVFYASVLQKHKQFYDSQFPENSAFRMHTKGKGAKCIERKGISQGTFIVEYFGEMYEPWRWYERQDFIKEILKKKKLKQVIPEFYNIYLQKHKDEPLGYDILVVDPFKKGNFSSRFSHSCNPNCGTIITVSDGKYYIGMYSIKDIEFGQQLTFDYCSMTESNYEHTHSICLCGMEKCRGNYLQLSNSKIYNNLMDNNSCFHFRNSLILRAQESEKNMKGTCSNRVIEDGISDYTEQKIKQYCDSANIKSGILSNVPKWLQRWCGIILNSIEKEASVYKQQTVATWQREYPWGASQNEQQKNANIQLYSSVFKSDLINLRNQNLTTTIDKIKYYLTEIKDIEPPLFYERKQKVCEILIENSEPSRGDFGSILIQLQDQCMNEKMRQQATTIEKFLKKIRTFDGQLAKHRQSIQGPATGAKGSRRSTSSKSQQIQQQAAAEKNDFEDPQRIQIQDAIDQIQSKKLFYFRLCCLLVSHMIFCRGIPPSQHSPNTLLLSDIIYFYSFTHTYFSPHQYTTHTSEEIKVTLQEILGDSCTSKFSDRIKKKYTSPFIWGQMVSWFKQTIVNPEASLSQDRRGTLSYPIINTILKSSYPFQKHMRHSFLKSLREKPSSSWPPAKGLELSYKNPYKCYGTVLFESVHNSQIFMKVYTQGKLPRQTLLDNVIDRINLPFKSKLQLFKEVQHALEGHSPDNEELYGFLDCLDVDYDKTISSEELIKLEPLSKKQRKITKSIAESNKPPVKMQENQEQQALEDAMEYNYAARKRKSTRRLNNIESDEQQAQQGVKQENNEKENIIDKNSNNNIYSSQNDVQDQKKQQQKQK